jgi:hypothetical protein
LYKKDYETEEAWAQQRAVEPLMNENEGSMRKVSVFIFENVPKLEGGIPA